MTATLPLPAASAPTADGTTTPGVAAESTTTRIAGIDLARLVAVVGMIVMHTAGAMTTTWYAHLAHGRSAILFCTLAGVGLALISGGAPRPKGRMAGIRRSVAVRGLVLALTGLALASLPHNYISIVLVTYAVLFWAAIPLLRAGARTLWTITLTGAAALPVVTMFLARRFPVDPADLGSHVAQTPILQDLWHPDRWDTVATLTLIGGSYPALVWVPVALAGIAAVRSGWLTRPGRMLAAGVAGMVAGYGGAWLTAGPLGLRADGQFNEMTGEVDQALPAEAWHALFAATPHSGSIAEIVGAVGVAFTVLALCLVAMRLPLRRALAPLAAAGSLPLSIYIGHVVVISRMEVGSTMTLRFMGLLIAGCIAAAWLWQRFLGRGPAERVLTAAGNLAAGKRPRLLARR